MAMQERLKVLPGVSVHALQNALDKGFKTIGHRSLLVFLPLLEGMNWKTAASKHAAAYVQLEPLLRPLLEVCKNGLIPDAMLLSAFYAYSAEHKFEWSQEVSVQATITFFFMKLRQMVAKLRDLVSVNGGWEVLAKKLTQQQHEVIARLCRCLQPSFLSSEQLSNPSANSWQTEVNNMAVAAPSNHQDSSIVLWRDPAAKSSLDFLSVPWQHLVLGLLCCPCKKITPSPGRRSCILCRP